MAAARRMTPAGLRARRRRVIASAVVGLVVSLGAGVYWWFALGPGQATSALSRAFPDRMLRSCVADALGVGEDAIVARRKLNHLSELICSHEPSDIAPAVTDLEGIQTLSGLRSLTIADIAPEVERGRSPLDISALAHHKSIRRLDLGKLEIAGLDAISTMGSLERVDLSWSRVLDGSATDLTVVSDLPHLKELDVWGLDGLRSFHGLENAHALESLYSGCADYLPATGDCRSIDSVEPLRECDHLSYLIVQGTGVSDLSPLQGNVNLSYVDISGTRVHDLAPLTRSVNLTTLKIGDTPVRDITPLVGHRALRVLELTEDQHIDTSALDKTKGLEITIHPARGTDGASG